MSSPPASERPSLPSAVGLFLLLAVTAIFSILTYFHMAEDAFISFRYVRNAAAGHGLVYNPGERVEGYSNLLWVLLLIPVKLSGLSLELGSRILSTLFFLGVIATAWGCARRQGSEETRGWLAWWLPIAIALDPLLHYHDDSGLETVPYAALLGAALLLLGSNSNPLLAGALAAGAVLMRPEGIGFAVALAPVAAVARMPRLRITRRSVVAMLIFLALPVAAFAGQLLFRLAYYCEWVPNTVIAKRSGGGGGFGQILAYAATRAGLPLLAVAGAAWGLHNERLRPLAVGVLATLAAAALFQLRAGGLLNIGFRYLAPAFIPTAVGVWLLLMQLGEALHSEESQAAPRWLLPAVGILGLLAAPVLLWSQSGPLAPYLRGHQDAPLARFHSRLFQPHTYTFAERWKWYTSEPVFLNAEAGRWVREHLPPDALLAADQMGMLGFYAHPGAPIVDLLGLMDYEIARHGLKLDNLFQRQPRYIIVEATQQSHWWPRDWREKPHVPWIRDLFQRPEFQARYVPRWFLIPRLSFSSLGFMVYVDRAIWDSEPMETVPIGVSEEEFNRAWRVLP